MIRRHSVVDLSISFHSQVTTPLFRHFLFFVVGIGGCEGSCGKNRGLCRSQPLVLADKSFTTANPYHEKQKVAENQDCEGLEQLESFGAVGIVWGSWNRLGQPESFGAAGIYSCERTSDTAMVSHSGLALQVSKSSAVRVNLEPKMGRREPPRRHTALVADRKPEQA